MSHDTRRIRAGRFEWQCRCGRWYWKLVSHLRRYHNWKYHPNDLFIPDPFVKGRMDPYRSKKKELARGGLGSTY